MKKKKVQISVHNMLTLGKIKNTCMLISAYYSSGNRHKKPIALFVFERTSWVAGGLSKRDSHFYHILFMHF